jgi:PAT family beta-lactamase induction signal transducer AmpG
MLLIQLLLVAALVVLALLNPQLSTASVAIAAVALAFLSASQDVVIDAYRTEYLDEPEYAAGAAMVVFGYRLGMLSAGAGALGIADVISWEVAYLAMAAIMAAALVVTLFLPEPENATYKERAEGESLMQWLKTAFVEPFRDFMTRHPHWWLILLLVFTYRLPDGLIGFMTTPFFLDIGFTKSEVAAIAKVYGFGATLIGMFLGGWLVSRLGIARSMVWFMLWQIATTAIYVLLSESGPKRELLMLVIACDNLAGGMITTVAVAYIMSLCNLAFTATQYALLSSLASLASKSIAALAGFIAESQGWTGLFVIAAAAGIPALLMLLLFSKQLHAHSRKEQAAS